MAEPDPPVGVVIPAYQAAATLADVIAGVRRAVPTARLVVVDDGSVDGTDASARRTGATVVRWEANRGKGAALAAGIDRVLGLGAGWVVTLDADGQHPAAAIPALLAPLGAGAADLVLGARRRTAAMPLARRGTNWLSSVLASRIAGHTVPDAQTGFRAFTRAVAERVRPTEARFDYEIAFLLGAVTASFRVVSVEVPTLYGAPRSHFRSIRDTWNVGRIFVRHGARIVRGVT